MNQVVVMVEEESARIVVEAVAQKLDITPPRLVTIPHQGKSDLEKSIPIKLARWRSPVPPRFVLLRDNDRANCRNVKNQILDLIPGEAAARTKVRIVTQELEAWYFGDLGALESAGLLRTGAARQLEKKAKFRNPDEIQAPKLELRKLVDAVGQISLARKIAPHMNLDVNRSRSFMNFVSALQWASGNG